MQKKDKKLETDLHALLDAAIPGIEISVDHSERWKRMCAMFRSAAFRGLLPEERFRKLIAHLPEEFREERMAGFVWLELADDESEDQFLRLPRSEDVVGREKTIYAELLEGDFFGGLREVMNPTPAKSCKGDFSFTKQILDKKKFSANKTTDAKLLFIRFGAYCDCQVIDTVEAELAAARGKKK